MVEGVRVSQLREPPGRYLVAGVSSSSHPLPVSCDAATTGYISDILLQAQLVPVGA